MAGMILIGGVGVANASVDVPTQQPPPTGPKAIVISDPSGDGPGPKAIVITDTTGDGHGPNAAVVPGGGPPAP